MIDLGPPPQFWLPKPAIIRPAELWRPGYDAKKATFPFPVMPPARSTANDPNFANVVLLCGFQGTNGATSTSDESSKGHSLTFVGNAQISTGRAKFGTSSLLLDGSGDYLTSADSNDWLLSGAFTIEAFIYPEALRDAAVVAQYVSGGAAWNLETLSGGAVRAQFSTSGTSIAYTAQITTGDYRNAWSHVCFERDASNKMRVYFNGVMGTTAPTGATGSSFNATTVLTIGARTSGGNPFQGSIAELRITNGVARYASDSGFTVPTAAFPRS